jgi:hypothetical protein
MEVDTITSMLDAITNQHWPLAIALCITIVVAILRRFVAVVKDKRKYIPYIILITTILSSVSARMMQGIELDKNVLPFVINGLLEGLMVGLASMGWWSAGVKKVE